MTSARAKKTIRNHGLQVARREAEWRDQIQEVLDPEPEEADIDWDWDGFSDEDFGEDLMSEAMFQTLKRVFQ